MTPPRTASDTAAPGIPLSRLTLGTSAWRDAAARGADPRAVLDLVLSGAVPEITAIDTSNEYGGGFSEELIGAALRTGSDAGTTVISKLDRDPETGSFDGDRMRRSLEETLTRLGVDRLPLLHLHDPNELDYVDAFAPGGPVPALVRMRAEGIVDRIGISGAWAPMLVGYVETGLFDAVVTHNRYTLVDRSAGRLLDAAARRGVLVFNAAPYGSAPLAKWPAPVTHYAYRAAHPELAAAITAMGAVAADAGIPLGAAALQFSLRDDRVASTIVGINSVEQLDRTREWARTPISGDVWAALEDLVPGEWTWQEPPGPSSWDHLPTELLENLIP